MSGQFALAFAKALRMHMSTINPPPDSAGATDASTSSTSAPRNAICKRDALADGGAAQRFSVEIDGRTMPGFVISHAGNVHAWLNQCPHRGTELDWQPGVVFDDSGLYLVCATHGALFQPHDGFCTSGPCMGASLKKIDVSQDETGHVILRRGRLC
jgi:nitrite reductase/ring-hydroxylating ferredoxin subunit